MKSNLIIRPASIDDAESICDVHHSAVRALAGGPYDNDTLDAWHDAMTVEKAAEATEKPDMLAFVALEDGAVVGFGLMQKGLVNAIYVHPLCQGRGIGSRLFTTIEREAVSQGIQFLTLNASFNARPFYERHGFHVVREDVNPLNEEVSIKCLVMEKDLEVV